MGKAAREAVGHRRAVHRGDVEPARIGRAFVLCPHPLRHGAAHRAGGGDARGEALLAERLDERALDDASDIAGEPREIIRREALHGFHLPQRAVHREAQQVPPLVRTAGTDGERGREGSGERFDSGFLLLARLEEILVGKALQREGRTQTFDLRRGH